LMILFKKPLPFPDFKYFSLLKASNLDSNISLCTSSQGPFPLVQELSPLL